MNTSKILIIIFALLLLLDFKPAKASELNGGQQDSVFFEADSLSYENNGNNILASGQAKLYFKTYIIEADSIEYDKEIDKVTAAGNVVMTEKNNIQIYADRIVLSEELKKGFIQSANIILQNGAKITAQEGELDLGNINKFSNATYTVCEKCKEDPECPYTWEFEAEKVLHDEKNKKIEYENVKFKLLDKTIIQLPYFSYPDMTVQRQSGYLLPEYSLSNFYGHAVSVPYFHVIDETSDLTVSPLITSKQGPLFKFEYRKKTKTNGDISIKPSFIYQADPLDVAPGDKSFRAGIKTKADIPINNEWNWGWDATYSTDDTYMRRYEIDSSTKNNSNVYLTGVMQQNYLSLAAFDYNNLLAENEITQAEILPLVEYDHTFKDIIFDHDLKFTTQASNLLRNSGDEQSRVSTSLHWDDRIILNSGLIFEPYLGLRSDFFRTYDKSDDESTYFSRLSPELSVQSSWPLFNNNNLGKQILEPIARLTFISDEETDSDILNEDSKVFNFNTFNLFDIDRAYGYDKIDGGSKLSFGVNYSLQDKIGGNLNASIGKSYHIGGKNSNNSLSWTGTNTKHSDIVGSISYNLDDFFGLDYKTRFDDSFSEPNLHELNMNIKNADSFLLNLNFTDITSEANLLSNNDLEEISGDLELGLTKDWSLITAGTYNLESEDVMNSLLGLKFDNECLSLGLAYKETFFTDRDVKKDQSFLLNFELKTSPK